ncbi:hypothetical protein ACSQ67_011892 [Phaseolus vulgaris]
MVMVDLENNGSRKRKRQIPRKLGVDTKVEDEWFVTEEVELKRLLEVVLCGDNERKVRERKEGDRIYRLWIYPVVKKGVNEFGFGGEDDQAVPEADAAMEEEKKTIMIWFSLNSLRKFHSRYLVRSMDIGFQGSWHPGTVILCEDLQRRVRYNNILDDKEAYYLEEVVTVSKALDGDIECANCYARGFIRPLPPFVEFDRGTLHLVEIHHLRITQDWDEITEEWTRRENWVFLDLVEEQKSNLFVTVSAKQIWYDIRIKKEFEVIREWTCNLKYLWTELIKEVVNHYLSLTVKEIISVLNLPRSLLNETPEQEFAEAMPNVDLSMIWHDKEIVVQKEIVPPIIQETLPDFQDEISPSGDSPFEEESRENRSSSHLRSTIWKPVKLSGVELCPDAVREYPLASKRKVRAFWMDKLQKHLVCLGWKIVWSNRLNVQRYKYIAPYTHGRRYYLSLIEVCEAMKQDPDMKSLHLQNVRSIMHPTVNCHPSDVPSNLAEDIQNLDIFPPAENIQNPEIFPPAENIQNLEIVPPAENTQNLEIVPPAENIQSLEIVPRAENIQSLENFPPAENVQNLEIVPPAENIQSPEIVPPAENIQSLEIVPPAENVQNLEIFPPAENIQNLDIFSPVVSSTPVEDEGEDVPEYCPRAVVQYYRMYISNKSRAEKKRWILKAKKHLLAEGWVFDYPPVFNKKRGIIYVSPQNRRFPTLHGACKYCIEESIPNWNLEWQETDEDASSSKSITNQKKKNKRDLKANTPKYQSNGLPLQVLRSDKRVQKVSDPAHLHHKPLNIPSYLIDSNIILPRSKVYYKTKGRHRKVRTLGEGKINRNGIKCNCCLKIYSFAGFEKHVSGSSTCRPSASIFLDDGKSLLDCQIQMMQSQKTREAIGKSLSDLSLAENDYICSVCHFGGELILCDKCPSSFHKTCLGLEVTGFVHHVVAGFVAKGKLMEMRLNTSFLAYSVNINVYHVRCLKKGAADTSRYNGNWFCGKDCEKIYEGLHKLLGEPVPVANNLTWTLVKFINPNSCDFGNIASDLLAESYCKLNVALSLMHECFEPLKESLTCRDLVEDVIFSRRSELNRINFQGFYTVLLDKNEELVSVATVRVHGKKVAEIPLVGTRLQYRRHGMCRILVNELEKKLMKLDVERLVLPAVPSVLETWTNSFGFAKMTIHERSQFLGYTFLDFEGTVMCQKLLMNIASSDSVPLIEYERCCVNHSKSSPVCEVHQGEDIDKDTCASNNDHHVIGAIDPFRMVEEPDHQNRNGTTSTVCSFDKQVDRNDVLYKFVYTRRKNRES